jgi:hypothetical protein
VNLHTLEPHSTQNAHHVRALSAYAVRTGGEGPKAPGGKLHAREDLVLPDGVARVSSSAQ